MNDEGKNSLNALYFVRLFGNGTFREHGAYDPQYIKYKNAIKIIDI